MRKVYYRSVSILCTFLMMCTIIMAYPTKAFAAPNNAGLSGLTLSEGTLDTAFDTETESYTAAVDYSVSSITVTPTAADTASLITVDGVEVSSGESSQAIPLNTGENIISIVVTASDASTKNYTVTVTRTTPISNNADLSMLSISEGSLDTAFDAGTISYNAVVADNVTSITVTPTTADSAATITVQGEAVASGIASQAIPLNTGDNTINIIVTAQDLTTKEYTVVVTRSTSVLNTSEAPVVLNSISNDATLQQVQVYTYTDFAYATIDDAAGTITAAVYGQDQYLWIIPNSPGATYVIQNNATPDYVVLSPGENVYTLEVTAEDGVTVKTYTMTLTRLLSSDVTMAYLLVYPAFGADYVAAMIDDATDTITSTVYGQDHVLNLQPFVMSTPWVVKQGGVALPTNDSGDVPVSLEMGDNIFTVEVTSEDGSATKTYTMTLTRGVSSSSDFIAYLLDPFQNYENIFYYFGMDYNSGIAYGADHLLSVVPYDQLSTYVIKDQQGDVIPAVNGHVPISLTTGDNIFIIEGTAEDGTFRTNTLMLTREVGVDNSLNSVQVYTPADQHTETATIDNTNFTVNAQTYGQFQTLRIQPNVLNSTWVLKQGGNEIVATSSTEVDVTLDPGINTFDLEVTAETGEMQLYTLTIERLISSIPELQSVTAYSPDTLTSTNAVINEAAQTAAARVVTPLQNIYATPLQRFTTVTILDSLGAEVLSDPVTLSLGDNIFTIELTTESGATSTYDFTLTLSQPKVTFNSNGGTPVNPIFTDLNTTITEPAAPTRVGGYTFGGWYKNAALTIPWIFATDTVTADTTLYAKWTGGFSYTVSFYVQPASAISSITALHGNTITEPSPYWMGHYVEGWYKESAKINKWNFATDTVTSNMTLYANWAAEIYEIMFDSQGGSDVPSIFVSADSYIPLPAAPTRLGYVFLGWYQADLQTPYWNNYHKPMGNMLIFAKWAVETHTVTFNSQGGSPITSIVANYDTIITEPAAPTRTGYTFNGWYKEDTFTTPWDFANDTVTTDITLYAKWTVNNYLVTFDSNLGSAVDSVNADYNTTITEPAEPTRTEHTFNGWYKDVGLTSAWNFATDVVTGDITLYAKWTINQYTVTFDSQLGSDVPSINADYNTSIMEPAAPTRTGYTFAGWYTEDTLANAWDFATDTVTTNITLYAKWTLNNYLVTFNSNSGSDVPSVNADYNTTITEPAAPTRTGYTFGGWYKETSLTNVWNFATDVVTDNTILYAKWIANSYIVTFNSNLGSAVPSINADYDTTITAPPVPIRMGYTFSGWYKEAELLNLWNFATDKVTGNMMLYAKWTISAPLITLASTSYTAIRVSWSAVPYASGYEVWRSTTKYGTYSLKFTSTSASAGSYISSGLTTDKIYYFKVRAYQYVSGVKVYGDYSATQSSAPGQVAMSVTRISSSSAKVSWVAISGSAGYEVWRGTQKNGTYSLKYTGSSSATSWTNTGLTTGKAYYYKVRAYRMVRGTKVYGADSPINSVVP